jgi:hypothetical protein
MLRSIALVCAFATTVLAQSAPPGDVPTAPQGDAPPAPTGNAAPGYVPAYVPTYGAPRPERPDRFFVGLGVVAGGNDDWLYGAYTGELALTILPELLRMRARLFGTLYGGSLESDWNGDFARVGVGLEARGCTSGGQTCLFADLDLGYQKLSLYDDSQDFVRSDVGAFGGPRFGVDFGGALRVRFALELYEQLARHTKQSGEKSFDVFGTVGVSLAVGLQL